jgi:hypothetical protein
MRSGSGRDYGRPLTVDPGRLFRLHLAVIDVRVGGEMDDHRASLDRSGDCRLIGNV